MLAVFVEEERLTTLLIFLAVNSRHVLVSLYTIYKSIMFVLFINEKHVLKQFQSNRDLPIVANRTIVSFNTLNPERILASHVILNHQ